MSPFVQRKKTAKHATDVFHGGGGLDLTKFTRINPDLTEFIIFLAVTDWVSESIARFKQQCVNMQIFTTLICRLIIDPCIRDLNEP